MCRIDGAERSTVLSSGYKVARKDHKCAECYRPIAKGERYYYEAITYDGYFDTHKTCQHCQVARDWLVQNCGGFIYGEVIEEIEEHAQDYPDLRRPLRRIVAGASRKWAFRGALVRVPAMPPAITVHH